MTCASARNNFQSPVRSGDATVPTRNHAKFRGNRSKHYRDIAIFRILEFLKILKILTVDTFNRVTVLNFMTIGQTVAHTLRFFSWIFKI